MINRTAYQEKIIRNYYANRDQLMQQKLGDLISELYLAEGKKRTQLWRRVAQALTNLGVPQDQIDHLQAEDKPELLVRFLDS